jgi:hypothetical protein
MTMNTVRFPRRRFLLQSAALAGAAVCPQIVRAAVTQGGEASPVNRVGLGCIGLGIQGMGNLRTFLGHPEVRVAAVCDVHATQLENGKAPVDNVGDAEASALLDRPMRAPWNLRS